MVRWIGIGILLGLTVAPSARAGEDAAGSATEQGAAATGVDGLWAPWCEIVSGRLESVYPVLARQIVDDSGMTEGMALDLDAGAGGLTIALGRITDLRIHAVNLDPALIGRAHRSIADAGLAPRVAAVRGDVRHLGYPSDSVDLIVSRGAFRFWTDKAAVFAEIYRVLKPRGRAYIGGGFGRSFPAEEGGRLWEALKGERERIGLAPEWERTKPVVGEIERALAAAGVADYRIVPEADCPCRMWIEFRKP